MIDIIDLSEQVYQFLSTSDLTYSYRKSNYAGRLDQGYWFYGTEKYFAISFWSGMDWKNRTPNINFVVTQTGSVFLEIAVSDSDRKKEFIERFIRDQIGLGSNNRFYRKYYGDNKDIYTSLELLQWFLNHDKNEIDRIIRLEAQSFFLPNEDGIGFIDRKEFNARKRNIEKYRDEKLNEKEIEVRYQTVKPNKIKSFKIWNYGPLDYADIKDVPYNNQWIFITGQNGSGKTSFLRAISTILGYRVLNKKEVETHRNFKAETELYLEDGTRVESYERHNNEDTKNRRPKVSGLCMYGPFRLLNSKKLSERKFKDLYTKKGSFSSLFSDNSPLLDIDRQLDLWKKDEKEKSLLEKREYYIKNILIDVVPNLYNINFRLHEIHGKSVIYQTRQNDLSVEYNESWENLSSGTKSVFSLIIDILLRLYDQQPKIVDPSELEGIVLIDEIDLHLHPQAQKDLVINLSNVFKAVQFIVTTHSPIPLLGAPLNSMIYVMSNHNGTIEVQRMDDKVMFSRIMPNAIFSSPIFGFDDLIPASKPKDKVPYLEDDYKQIEQIEKMNNDIKSFLNNDKQKELLELFTNKPNEKR